MGNEQQVAVVTGAASGIGRATAVRLAANGFTVVGLDLEEEGAAATASAIADAGGPSAHAIGVDVRDEPAVQAAVAEAVALAGGVDVLVNAAGIVFYRTLAETTQADLQSLLAVNLLGTYALCRAAAPHLVARRGAIVNVASAAGLNGRAYLSAYSASKGAVVALSRSLAVELAPEVRVNAVCPSAVDTPMVAAVTVPDDVDRSKMARHPMLLGRLATAEEIAAAIAFLASPESGSTTGAVLAIDGGAGA
jgi:meso-butanediol dehydrogenase / (S,S)-butanediol dehydrogenase / diacetyl reductase